MQVVGRASVPAAFGGTGFQPVTRTGSAWSTKNLFYSVLSVN